MRFNLRKLSEKLFRFAIALIFLYFGYLAITDPVNTGNRFISAWALNIIRDYADLTIFVVVFGIAQVAVGLAIIFKILLKWVLLIAALMLVGIIASLGIYTPGAGINELALRDLVILTGVIYLFFQIR